MLIREDEAGLQYLWKHLADPCNNKVIADILGSRAHSEITFDGRNSPSSLLKCVGQHQAAGLLRLILLPHVQSYVCFNASDICTQRMHCNALMYCTFLS